MYGLILWVVGFVYATIHCNIVLLWDVCIIGCVCVLPGASVEQACTSQLCLAWGFSVESQPWPISSPW